VLRWIGTTARAGTVTAMTTTAAPLLTPSQVDTFDRLLALGAERPMAPAGLVDELRAKIEQGTSAALDRWTERSLWLGKSQLTQALRCEGQTLAEASSPRARGLHPATAVGIVSHRAVQMASTHPGLAPLHYVEQGIAAALAEDGFREFWTQAPLAEQSDLTMQMVSRTTAFLDSWPPLDPSWSWRFEEPCQAKVGSLTLGARIDLVLGRPRGDGRQTMLLCDLKTGSLSDHHITEADFYALVATLRYGVPPFRSTVYSLASGTWTDPDIDAIRLHRAADQVVQATNSIVDVLTSARRPELTGGMWCRWCPARDTCPAVPEA
jgi:hypothetical protein